MMSISDALHVRIGVGSGTILVMPRKPPSERPPVTSSRLVMDLTVQGVARLVQLQEMDECTRTLVVERAIALFFDLRMARARGATLEIREPDGAAREIWFY